MERKNNYLILLSCVMLLFFVQCSRKNIKYQLIPVPIKNNSNINLNKIKTIYIKDFKIDNTKGDKNIIFKNFIDEYFQKELSAHIGTPILPYPSESPQEDCIIINGNLVLKVQKSNIIRKVKKKKQFVKIENWSLELELIINTPKEEKPLFKKTYNSALKEVESNDPIYNFKTILYRCGDGFSKDIFREEKMELRYLLLK